jgi:hypothetical protein
MAGIHRFSKFKAARLSLFVGASWQCFEDLARSRISNHSPQPEREAINWFPSLEPIGKRRN